MSHVPGVLLIQRGAYRNADGYKSVVAASCTCCISD